MCQLQILGVPIEFPYSQVYPSQKALIANSIRSFKNQENALLESPTGTGKALALLTSSLAYQKYVVDNQIHFEKTLNFVSANDTFSIFNTSSSQNSETSSKSSSQTKIEPPRIWFTSRTHQQLKQLINEFKRLPYHPPMVVLGGRKKLCLNGTVLKSNDMSTECRRMMESGKCPFKMEAGIPNEFRPGGKKDKFDIEDMLEYGRKHFRCPYHMSLVILSKANLVFCPYNYIIDPMIKGMLELSLLNSILIVDEAHNIENVCRESGTFRVTSTDFIILMKSLSNMKNEIVSEDPDQTDLLAVTEFVQSIQNWFEENINLLKFIKKKEAIKLVSNVFKDWNLNGKNWPFYEIALNKIITKKTVVENEENEMHFANLSLLEKFFIFFVLAFQNNMDNFNKFQIVLTISGPNDDFNDFMLISCLDPSVIFKCVAKEVHSVVLASGTLSPLSTFAAELGTKFPIQLSANHIIDKEQIESFIITHGFDDTPFISNYQSMMQNKDSVIRNLGQMFLTLLPEIPGGVLLFLPSYKFLHELVDGWKQSGVWHKLNGIKKVFLEDSRSINQTFEKYQQTISKKLGGFLIGVCRGNMSEGMDFKDDQARAVFIFGIPYPNYQDIEIRLKRSYNDQIVSEISSQSSQSSQSPQSSQSFDAGDSSSGSQGSFQSSINRNLSCKPISGTDWYEAQAFRSVFQAIGRCIRHKNDYGAIFLIDQRFQSFASKFPRWVQNSFVSHNGILDIKQKLSVFYQEMINRYPLKVLFNRGQEILFECAECKQNIVLVFSIDFDQSEMTTRKGFLKLVDAKNDNNCIFLSRNTKIKLFVKPNMDENIWSQEDLSIYNLICCPNCGQKLGVRIVASTLSDSIYTDGFLFLLQKIAIHEGNDQKQKTEKSPKRQRKSKLIPEKGQQKLLF